MKTKPDMLDWHIGQNIRLVKDIKKITTLENIPAMAIFIDFKKAFDSVDWNFFAGLRRSKPISKYREYSEYKMLIQRLLNLAWKF